MRRSSVLMSSFSSLLLSTANNIAHRATIAAAVEKAASALPAFAAAFDKYTPWLNIDVDAYIAQLNLMTPGVQVSLELSRTEHSYYSIAYRCLL
jgi:hypothetical protein